MKQAEIFRENGPNGELLLVVYCQCERGSIHRDGLETCFEIAVTEEIPEAEACRRLNARWAEHRAEKHGETGPAVEALPEQPTYAFLPGYVD